MRLGSLCSGAGGLDLAVEQPQFLKGWSCQITYAKGVIR